MLANLAFASSDQEMEAPPPSSNKRHEETQTWLPKLNPTQLEMFNDPSRFILAYGERGSGKSIGALHKLVRHCWEEMNALAVIIVGVKRQALEGGAWYKLQYDILPQWQAGIGITWTESKTNTAKDDFLFVSNRHGGFSKILLLSMPVETFIRDRAKGMEPSFMLVEEIQTLASDAYFSVLVQQLGRRPGIKGPQQYVATANPEGPSHWVYKRFFDLPRDKETGDWNQEYKIYHVPISENEHNLPERYYDNVLEAVKDDPVEYKRMVLGEWIDRPSGEAVFKNHYDPLRHLRGSIEEGTRILPDPKFDVVVGYDPGTANSAVVFLQNLVTAEGEYWTAFDELILIDRHVSYPDLVPAIMRRMQFWNEQAQTKFNYVHVSDSSAFNQFRATHGTYDALEIERLSQASCKYFKDLKPIHLVECPKPPHSVPARVKLTMKLLQQDRLFISASCTKLQEMFLHLEAEKMNDKKYSPDLLFTPKRSRHVHGFDALSYPLFYYELDTIRNLIRNGQTNKPEFFGVGTS